MKIDHHLQLGIIERLEKSKTPLNFSELKEDGIDNSLFNFHLKKLLSRKLVSKTELGYSLSVEGARWLMTHGTTIKPFENSRVFIALVVRETASGKYLIGQRAGQFKVINDFILPSIRYWDGEDLTKQTENVVQKFVGIENASNIKEHGFMQISATYSDGKTMRSLFCVVSCETSTTKNVTDEFADYEWLEINKIAKLDLPSISILQQIIEYTKYDRNIHKIPVIVG